jgi:hypothetical protein
MYARFEGFQAFEEGAHHEPNASWGLLPILRRYVESFRKGYRLKQVAHDALYSCLVSTSLSQNGWASAEI